jgi:hypothetical protein
MNRANDTGAHSPFLQLGRMSLLDASLRRICEDPPELLLHGAAADHERGENLCILACSATPSEYVLLVRSRVGARMEFLSVGSRVGPFKRMFVACLLLRHGAAAHADDIESKSLLRFQKLGSVPKASHI